MYKKNSGFTLVELSVVIVIIGLIVAGIVGGSSLVRTSKLNTIISEVNATKLAYNSFYLQFSEAPGDFDKAYDYWGATCDADPIKCNGNGNRLISYTGGDSGSTNNTDDNETFRAWQHLHLAGLTKQPFSGKSVLGNPDLATKAEMFFSSTGLAKFFLYNPIGDPIFDKFPRNNLIVMGYPKIANIWTKTFRVADTISIDKKIDDGVANTGKILGATGGFVPDASCSAHWQDPTGADYNLSDLNSLSLQCIIVAVF